MKKRFIVQIAGLPVLAGAFVGGMIAGSTIFTSQQPAQTASTDGRTALAFLLNGSRGEPR